MVSNKVLTLAFILKDDKILLGYKKRGFGMGRWNGFGGKVEKGETIAEGAKSILRCVATIRELEEESGAKSEGLEEVGILMFEFLNDPQLLEVHVFKTKEYSGTITESDEMKPQWYSLDDIPLSQMWPDDHLWFPLMLSGKKFYGYFHFDGMDIILSTELKEIASLSEVTILQAPLFCGDLGDSEKVTNGQTRDCNGVDNGGS